MNRTQISSLGGRARAAKLSAKRRSEIAAMGLQARIDKYHGGDRSAYNRWFTSAGPAALDCHFTLEFRKFFEVDIQDLAF
jgi:hypothetical protein